ncbi:hypothetical protein EV694_2147 [Volucribacter psittacicida]|uniref:Uncharacterized protein n=1 Tax=Volucribacter psittacicida TaxID=203482 RepID=A0A4R1FL78_9PAST|nr:hypothetical protein EV694_2147 [Volucribacter psittacicida]
MPVFYSSVNQKLSLSLFGETQPIKHRLIP